MNVIYIACNRRAINEAKFARTPIECWEQLITEDMIKQIVTSTNEKIGHFPVNDMQNPSPQKEPHFYIRCAMCLNE